MSKETTETQLFYLPPPQLSKWKTFKRFMWNSETKEFMGRTAASWAKVTLFYLIFYSCLAAFFILLLTIFYQTINDKEPKWTLESSLIGSTPGLGFRPRPPPENIESTLIWFKHGKNGNWDYWADNLHSYIMNYAHENQTGDKYYKCISGEKVKKDKVCQVDIHDYKGLCSAAFAYGYKAGQPCIAVKINRVFNWVPIAYKKTDPNIPMEIRSKVLKDSGSKVWITCGGENAFDKENIGQMIYSPNNGGIETYYFPFKNQPGYLTPLVFVQFASVKKGVLINVECRAWAKNIAHDRAERKGSIHLELLVD
uniref:Sodium/potassium-transporting ATPase subunit beta n=1 Tax=Strigamia maritima TaxID=126957 RepID=T1ILP1_STRMM